jgi:acyl carrier protein
MSETATTTKIWSDLEHLLRNFHGREYSGPIGPETRFFADLGLASIDAIVLGESLQQLYGQTLPFGELMADLGRRDDRDLRLGELADFLSRHLENRFKQAHNVSDRDL